MRWGLGDSQKSLRNCKKIVKFAREKKWDASNPQLNFREEQIGYGNPVGQTFLRE